MAEPITYSNGYASPQAQNATPAKPGRNQQQRTPSAAQGQHQGQPQGQGQEKRNNRPRRNNGSQRVNTPLDGTVSDSMTNPAASPRTKKPTKPRQTSNATATAIPIQNGHPGQTNGHRGKNASYGGNMQPATPAKEQAYAGPTFAASPAPSSLPVPKFFSRSVPNAGAHPSLQARMEGAKSPDRQESSPETDAASPVPVPRGLAQSPLDVFFNADRAEREHKRSGSGQLSPEMARRPVPSTEPRNPSANSGRNMFMQELDGSGEELSSPRIKPQSARPPPTERSHSSPGPVPQQATNEQHREASTQALKDLLFSNLNMPTTKNASPQLSVTPPPQRQPQANQHNPFQGPQTPSPFHRPHSGPTTPVPSTEQQNQYSLHYGNRNLSPMFKAVRAETPTRPSSLRQELGDGGNGNTYPQSSNNNNFSQQPNNMNYPSHASGAPHGQPQQQFDPNAFSRNYLESQIRSSGPVQTPPGLISNGMHAGHATYPYPPQQQPQQQQFQYQQQRPQAQPSSQHHPFQKQQFQQQHQHQPQPQQNSPGGPRDLKDMEDKLRNVLKLGI